MNIQNLFYFYQSMINQTYKSLTNGRRLVRLSQNKKEMDTNRFIDYISFAYQSTSTKKTIYDINDVDGIFPEIGALLANDNIWQNLLLIYTIEV